MFEFMVIYMSLLITMTCLSIKELRQEIYSIICLIVKYIRNIYKIVISYIYNFICIPRCCKPRCCIPRCCKPRSCKPRCCKNSRNKKSYKTSINNPLSDFSTQTNNKDLQIEITDYIEL
jgi:hypothetical protein